MLHPVCTPSSPTTSSTHTCEDNQCVIMTKFNLNCNSRHWHRHKFRVSKWILQLTSTLHWCAPSIRRHQNNKRVSQRECVNLWHSRKYTATIACNVLANSAAHRQYMKTLVGYHGMRKFSTTTTTHQHWPPSNLKNTCNKRYKLTLTNLKRLQTNNGKRKQQKLKNMANANATENKTWELHSTQTHHWEQNAAQTSPPPTKLESKCGNNVYNLMQKTTNATRMKPHDQIQCTQKWKRELNKTCSL